MRATRGNVTRRRRGHLAHLTYPQRAARGAYQAARGRHTPAPGGYTVHVTPRRKLPGSWLRDLFAGESR